MENVKVSVIIPVYNMEDYLEKCLESVLAQTLKEIEIVCIDDGSTDETLNIMERYKENNDNIKIISQINHGAGYSQNVGIDAAKGEFIAFMGGDDYYADNDVLEYLYTCAKKEHVTVCGGGLLYEREGKISRSKSKNEFFNEDNKIACKDYQYIFAYAAFIFCKKFLKDNSIYFPNYRRFQDVPFTVKVLLCANNLYVVAKGIYVYRMTDKLISYDNDNIINGIAQGIDDVLLMSKEARYEMLHVDIVQKMLDIYLDWFYKSVYDGNKVMVDLMKKIWDDIDEELLIQDGRITSKPKLKLDNEVREYIELSRERKEEFWKCVNRFKYVIIYGAGVVGRRLFEYLRKNKYEGRVEFGVSELNSTATACGRNIRTITSYLRHKDDALVLIAVKGNDSNAMLNTAKQLGYINVEVVNYNDLRLF